MLLCLDQCGSYFTSSITETARHADCRFCRERVKTLLYGVAKRSSRCHLITVFFAIEFFWQPSYPADNVWVIINNYCGCSTWKKKLLSCAGTSYFERDLGSTLLATTLYCALHMRHKFIGQQGPIEIRHSFTHILDKIYGQDHFEINGNLWVILVFFTLITQPKAFCFWSEQKLVYVYEINDSIFCQGRTLWTKLRMFVIRSLRQRQNSKIKQKGIE